MGRPCLPLFLSLSITLSLRLSLSLVVVVHLTRHKQRVVYVALQAVTDGRVTRFHYRHLHELQNHRRLARGQPGTRKKECVRRGTRRLAVHAGRLEENCSPEKESDNSCGSRRG